MAHGSELDSGGVHGSELDSGAWGRRGGGGGVHGSELDSGAWAGGGQRQGTFCLLPGLPVKASQTLAT